MDIVDEMHSKGIEKSRDPKRGVYDIIDYTVRNHLPVGYDGCILISHGNQQYKEKQIRQFAKYLSYLEGKDERQEKVYRIDLTHKGGNKYIVTESAVSSQEEPEDPEPTPVDTYRRAWQITSEIDGNWVLFRKYFGEEEVQKMIDIAVGVQEQRERGEVE